MSSLNKVLLIGRLGKDPELRQTSSGHSVASVGLATSEAWKDQSGNKQERTEWHNLTFWNRLAEVVERYCRKGSRIYVEGSLKTEKYQDRDGNDRWTTKVSVYKMIMLDSKKGDGGSDAGYQGNQGGYGNTSNNQQAPYGGGAKSYESRVPDGYAQPGASQTPKSDDLIEDDIPF